MISSVIRKTILQGYSKTPAVLAKPLCITSRLFNSSSIVLSDTISEDNNELLKRIKIKPLERKNETRETKIARLIYQSRKRGILETDILLSGFASKYLKKFNDQDLKEYDSLLNELDWDIYYWATKNYKITKLPERWSNSNILKLLQDFSENKEKKLLKVPELSEY